MIMIVAVVSPYSAMGSASGKRPAGGVSPEAATISAHLKGGADVKTSAAKAQSPNEPVR